ncbi:hypothetical protein A2U01_0111570, partial [Trifolium medium]|nr:hypothetical protein [Trifolium medium]
MVSGFTSTMAPHLSTTAQGVTSNATVMKAQVLN